ncbi:MAG: PDZ domain-containing protein [Planctomycetaceae bacterium]|nr:PDZ domain-containing protein [Planctomycetaceae bacterium]
MSRILLTLTLGLLASPLSAQEEQNDYWDMLSTATGHHGITSTQAAKSGLKCSSCHTSDIVYGALAPSTLTTVDRNDSTKTLYSYYMDLALPVDDSLPIGISLSKPGDLTSRLLKLDGGLVVDAICPGQSGGLAVHDIIIKANDKKLEEPDQFIAYLKDSKDTVALSVKRAGVDEIVKIDLKPQQKQEDRYLIGVVLNQLDPVVNAQLKLDRDVSVIVTEVIEGSAADGKLEPRDILLKVNETPVKAQEDITEAVKKSEGKALTLGVIRNGETVLLDVTPKRVGDTVVDSLVQSKDATLSPLLHRVLIDPTVEYATVVEAYERAATVVPGKEKSSDERLKRIEAQLDRLTKLVEKLAEEK